MLVCLSGKAKAYLKRCVSFKLCVCLHTFVKTKKGFQYLIKWPYSVALGYNDIIHDYFYAFVFVNFSLFKLCIFVLFCLGLFVLFCFIFCSCFRQAALFDLVCLNLKRSRTIYTYKYTEPFYEFFNKALIDFFLNLLTAYYIFYRFQTSLIKTARMECIIPSFT